MFGAEVRAWITGLDGTGAVALTRSLMLAEANRLRADLGLVRITGNIYAADEGIDGRTDLAATLDSMFPVGRWTWQIKATGDPPSVVAAIEPLAVRQDIESGRNYVMVWSKDPPSRRALESALAQRVAEINPDARSLLIAAEDLERLARVHPAVVQALGGPAMIGLTTDAWSTHLGRDEYPFVTDDLRASQLEMIRDFAQSTTEQLSHLHVFGDTGVGKSRVVLEALMTEGVRERAFVALDYQAVDHSRLSALVSSEEAHAVVVVDDVSWDDAKRLEAFASASTGRLRLITIGDRPSRDLHHDSTSLDVVPLQGGVVAQLVERVAGLDQQQAELVAELAEGYPKLAIEIAKAVVGAAPSASVIDILRGATVATLLNEMLPDGPTRSDLSLLALVDRVGFEGEVSFETDQLCDAFEHDPARFRASVSQEEGHFVSPSGRFRTVTPKAFAMWLVRDRIERGPGELADGVVRFTPGVFESFRRQLEILGGDRRLDALIEEVLARRADWFRGAEGLTEDGARLLNAASFAVPDVAAHEIHQVVSSVSTADLLAIKGERRRELVSALEHLVWFGSTFSLAVDALFALATAENETYGNSATGIFVGSFQLHLGGTEVPFVERLAWLREAFERYGQRGAELAVDAAAAALSLHETRVGGWKGARIQPPEWRPATYDEEKAGRLDALDFLFEVLVEVPDAEPHAAKALADRLRSLFARGIGPELLERIRSREWSQTSRSRLASALRASLHYDTDLAESLREAASVAVIGLEGDSLTDRVEVVLRTRYWDLAFDVTERLSGPPVIDELAREVLSEGAPDLIEDLARSEPLRERETVGALFEAIGRFDANDLAEWMSLNDQVEEAARWSYVAGRGRRGDMDIVESWLEAWTRQPSLAPGVAPVVLMLPATPHRASLAVQAVVQGGAPVTSLNRLLLGAWIRPLPAANIEEILDLYLQQVDSLHGRDIEEAMTLLSFWLDEPSNRPTERISNFAAELMMRATSETDPSGGLSYAVSSLRRKLALDDEQSLKLVLASLQSPRINHDDDVEALLELALRNPARVVQRVIDLIVSDREGWSLYLRTASVLTRLRETVGTDTVVAALMLKLPEERAVLIAHLDWNEPVPDPAFVRLLPQADEQLLTAAETGFLFPGGGVSGPYSHYLKGRLATLEEWRGARIHGLNVWIDRVAPRLRSWIQDEELRESEERF